MIKNKIKLIILFFLCLNLNNKSKLIIEKDFETFKDIFKIENCTKFNEFLKLHNIELKKDEKLKSIEVIISFKKNNEVKIENINNFVSFLDDSLKEYLFKNMSIEDYKNIFDNKLIIYLKNKQNKIIYEFECVKFDFTKYNLENGNFYRMQSFTKFN